MAKVLPQIGSIACGCCGEVVPVREQSNGLAITTCNWCDSKLQAFGSKSDKIIRSRMKASARADENTPPDSIPDADPEKKQQAKKFNLFG